MPKGSMEYALENFQADEEFNNLKAKPVETAINCAFLQGWKAALEWIPVRIEMFRELEAKLKEEQRQADAQIVHEVYLAWVDGDYAPGEAFESAKEKIRHGGRT